MSDIHANSEYFSPSPDRPTIPDLTALAVSLQEAAQALLNLTTPAQTDESLQDKTGELTQQDEYRSYRVPFHILDDEQELLAEYGTDRIAYVLREIYTEFFLMLELMKGYAERNDDKDFTYILIAQQLFKPLDKLSKACSVLVDFELQTKEPALES